MNAAITTFKKHYASDTACLMHDFSLPAVPLTAMTPLLFSDTNCLFRYQGEYYAINLGLGVRLGTPHLALILERQYVASYCLQIMKTASSVMVREMPYPVGAESSEQRMVDRIRADINNSNPEGAMK